MVKTYIKKPMQVKAVQWDGTNFDEIQDFCKSQDMFAQDGKIEFPSIGTADVGSYVIKDEHDNIWICEKLKFEDLFIEADGRNYVFSGSFY